MVNFHQPGGVHASIAGNRRQIAHQFWRAVHDQATHHKRRHRSDRSRTQTRLANSSLRERVRNPHCVVTVLGRGDRLQRQGRRGTTRFRCPRRRRVIAEQPFVVRIPASSLHRELCGFTRDNRGSLQALPSHERDRIVDRQAHWQAVHSSGVDLTKHTRLVECIVCFAHRFAHPRRTASAVNDLRPLACRILLPPLVRIVLRITGKVHRQGHIRAWIH